ncbi:MAG: corrinoid protein [Deltaproteobacteria bacterium]|uniref:Corrinoid protein n=1 Tax=Candidatus Desulfacyla euxinica TaxID=2841693 RepID=A0A8J6N3U0_9DELT|nr:corrinoid protein [Candidatus Desulfacyla euxinica]
MSDTLQQINDAVITRKRAEIQGLVTRAIEEGIEPKLIIEDGLISAMDVIGKQFSDSDIFVPEMLVSALTMKLGLDSVKPLLKSEDSEPKGTIILGTVKGDIHDIGKNIVKMMLEGSGFEVVDLGVDLTVEKLVEQIDTIRPDILGLSALLTTTMPEMKNTIQELQEKGLREKIKIMVGGAPVSNSFAEEIGADGYGADAAEAVVLARKLIGV